MKSVCDIEAVPGTSRLQVGRSVVFDARKYTLRPDSPLITIFCKVVVAPSLNRIDVDAVDAVKVPVVEAAFLKITDGVVVALDVELFPKLFKIVRLLKAEE